MRGKLAAGVIVLSVSLTAACGGSSMPATGPSSAACKAVLASFKAQNAVIQDTVTYLQGEIDSGRIRVTNDASTTSPLYLRALYVGDWTAFQARQAQGRNDVEVLDRIVINAPQCYAPQAVALSQQSLANLSKYQP